MIANTPQGRSGPAAAGALQLPPGLSLETLPVLEIAADQQVFAEHDPCLGFPVLEGGCIRVMKSSADGRSLLLYRVAPGESCVISTSCLLAGRLYNAYGEAETECRLRLLPRERFERLLQDDVGFRSFVLGQYGQRMAALMERIDALAFQRFDQRLAACLLARAPRLQCTHQTLADELGSVREIVSRTLGAFAQAGWVRLARGRIEILDAAALRALAHSTAGP